MYNLLIKGGPLMWPLLACSVVSLALVLERFFFWTTATLRHDRQLTNRLFELTEAGNFEEAEKLGEGSRSIPARVLIAGLVHREYGLVQSMEAAAVSEIESMKRGLSVMDTIITLAPLLGILGTVSGIIISFDLLGQSSLAEPRAVTAGIAQALLTTAAGLSVAIMTLLPYNAFVRKVEKVTRYLERITTHFEVAFQKGLAKRNAPELRI